MSHALIFGASGLAGWSIVNQLLNNYPKKGTFAKVTAITNRPINLKDSFWPSADDGLALNLVSGVDLTKGSPEELRNKIEHLDTVSHVYYFAYKQENDPHSEVQINVTMLTRVITALNMFSQELKFVVFPSGLKAYIPGGIFEAPYRESVGHLPEPHASKIWYYKFQDILTRESEGRKWTWCDVRPDAIIGFAPHGSTFNLPAHWATYLSLYAAVEGPGATVSYPGNEESYYALYNEASATIIARFSIWASLHPEKTSAQVFNIADQAKGVSMAERWPILAKYFDLDGVGPQVESRLKPGEYIEKHKHVLEGHGLKTQVFKGDFLDEYGYWSTFDRWFSLDRVREVGFVEERDPNQSWTEAFDMMKRAGLILL